MDVLPERFEGIFFMGGGRSLAGVGERNGRSAVGVVDGEVKATFLCTSTVMAVVVVIVAVVLVVGLKALLEGVGSSGESGVRVEGTT